MAENLIFVTIFIVLFVFCGLLYSNFILCQHRKEKKEVTVRWKRIIESNNYTANVYSVGHLTNSDMSIQDITKYLKLTNGLNNE